MKRALLVMMLLLQGCSIWDGLGYATGLKDKCPKYGNAPSPVPVAELTDVWNERFHDLAIPADAEPWTWNIVSDADLTRICQRSDAAGCTDYRGGCPSTYTTQAYAKDGLLAAHEFAHAALFRRHVNTDPNHTNPDIWGAGGFIHSFER